MNRILVRDFLRPLIIFFVAANALCLVFGEWLDAKGIDHIVLMTPALPRTIGALTDLGLDLRRERDAGAFRQAFFKLGDVILEVVGPQEPGEGSSHLWGLTFCVENLEATAAFFGDRIGRVKDAVQPGRRITTLRGRDIGISPAIAFISER